MQTLTENVMRLDPPGSLFDEAVLHNLFPHATPGAKKLLVHRSLKHGEVLRLKPGIYCLAPEFRKSHTHPFAVAATLHSPSHVSLESALAWHGLIPEAVAQVSSVTVSRSRIFDTPLGTFSFQRVPCAAPRAGVRAVKLDANSWAFVAMPLRAIADLVYLRKEISWDRDGLGFLTDSMRMEADELRELPTEEYASVHDSMRNLRTKRYLEGLKKEMSP